MYVEDFIKGFPKEYVESVNKDYDKRKARIVFTPDINNKYNGHVFHVIIVLNDDLSIQGLGFMGMDLRPLQEWINSYSVFEGLPCHLAMIMDGFPQHLSVVAR